MHALSERVPGVEFCGIGGHGMLAAGLDPVVPMERLTMNAFAEPVRRLPQLVGIYRRLLRRFGAWRPDVFVGVDFNVFNGLIERRMHARGVPVAHYVSPSVYAWRRGRAARLARYTDLLLTLFPFEARYYRDLPVEVAFVGHPLANELAEPPTRYAARACLGVTASRVIAVLPGSRPAELDALFDDFADAAARFVRTDDDTEVLLAAAGPTLHAEIDRRLARAGLPAARIVDDAQLAMAAADGVLVKSGTATLEAMLIGRPMAVGYRLGPFAYRLVRSLLHTPWVALPNILAQETLVPELLQDDLDGARLAAALRGSMEQFESGTLARRFGELGASLRPAGGGDAAAAQALTNLLERSNRAAVVSHAGQGGW